MKSFIYKYGFLEKKQCFRYLHVLFSPFLMIFLFGGIQPAYCQRVPSELLSYINSEGNVRPVEALFEWQTKREQILDSMEALFGKFPGDPDKPPFDSKTPRLPSFNTLVKDSQITRFYIRYNIKFTVAQDEDVTAYLYIPTKKEPGEKYPAIIACQPTGALGKMIVDDQGPHLNRGYGKELAERGYVVIAPDYPGFGDQKDYDFDNDRYESGVMKSIFDNIRCVDFLQARNDVDPERIGIIGHSLGGHTAMFTAAFEPRIKVVISSSGWTLFGFYDVGWATADRGKLSPWAQKRYAPFVETKYHSKADEMPFDFDGVIAAIAPRPFFSNSPIHDANFNVEGVRIGIANASKVYHFLKADENLQVRYPVSSHDFIPEVRFEAYEFLDKFLK